MTTTTTTTTKVQTSTWTGTWPLTCRKPGPVRRISTRSLSVWLNHWNLLQFRNKICVNFTTNSSIHLIFIFRIQYVNLIFYQATSPPTTSSCKRRSAVWLQVPRRFDDAAELKAKLRQKKFGQKMETFRYKPSLYFSKFSLLNWSIIFWERFLVFTEIDQKWLCSVQVYDKRMQRTVSVGEWSLDRISLDRNCHFSVDRKF